MRQATRLSGSVSWMAWRHRPAFHYALSVLGSSSSNGCGSSEPLHSIRCADRNAPTSRACSLSASWVRHLQDSLQVALRPTRVMTSVYPRNAVGPLYFTRCTSKFMNQSTNAVILELAQVDGVAGLESMLALLVDAVRRNAPTAAILLVMWIKQSTLLDANKTQTLDSLERAALKLEVDVLRMDQIVLRIMSQPELVLTPPRCGTQPWVPPALFGHRARVATEWIFAQRGVDHVHPSPEGHLLIGRAVAQFLTDRLALQSPGTASRANHGSHRHEVALHASNGIGPQYEQCLNAQALPVRQGTPPWELIDEGGDKGVKKAGYVSRAVGDSMLVGPFGMDLQRQEQEAAAKLAGTKRARPRGWRPTMSMEVSYLLAPRDDFGAFVITCENCTCKREYNTFAKQLHPFPGVDTDSRLNPNPHYRAENFNSTVTATTEFKAWLDLPTPSVGESPLGCFLRITHVGAGSGLSSTLRRAICSRDSNKTLPDWCSGRYPSRVRIDYINAWQIYEPLGSNTSMVGAALRVI